MNRVPRKRGRPRKVIITEESFPAVQHEADESSSQSSGESEDNDNKPEEENNVGLQVPAAADER